MACRTIQDDRYCGKKMAQHKNDMYKPYTIGEVREMAKECGISLSTKGKHTKSGTVKKGSSHRKSKSTLCRQLRTCAHGGKTCPKPSFTSGQQVVSSPVWPLLPESLADQPVDLRNTPSFPNAGMGWTPQTTQLPFTSATPSLRDLPALPSEPYLDLGASQTPSVLQGFATARGNVNLNTPIGITPQLI